MGSLIGSNQIGFSLMSGRLKNVVAMTLTASPKKEPNMNPQNVVEMPHRKNISGVGVMGWGEENVRKFVSDVISKQPEISSRMLAREIVTQAYKFDKYKANDDITCVVVYVRKPRRTLIVTGAPRSRESDRRLGEIIRNYKGNVIVCGGTTAKIVARELGKDVKADRTPSGNLPPASIIEGVELVTEGMLTLSAVSERLSKKTLLKNMPEDPAKRIIKLLRETDQVRPPLQR